jgi:hypothetical protein
VSLSLYATDSGNRGKRGQTRCPYVESVIGRQSVSFPVAALRFEAIIRDPRHKAANWGGRRGGRKSARLGANRVVEPPPEGFRGWRACGRQTTHGRLRLRRTSKASVARHLPDGAGQTDGSGGRGVPTRVPALWRRHPPDLVHHGAGADAEDPHPLRRTARTAARRPTGESLSRFTTTEISSRRRLTSCTQSTSLTAAACG